MDHINENHVETLKDQIGSYFYFGTTPDAYLDEIQAVFQEAFAEHIYNYVELATEEVSDLDKQELLKKCASAFDETLSLCCDSVYNFIEQAIFRVPKHVELEQFKELDESVRKFSPDEDLEIDRDIANIQHQISEKRAYIDKLKENLTEIKVFEKSLRELKFE